MDWWIRGLMGARTVETIVHRPIYTPYFAKFPNENAHFTPFLPSFTRLRQSV